MKILVIDDEKSLRFTFEAFLTRAGYEVVTACDYDEAMARLAGTDFDLVFADIILGGKTGIDIMREVRQRSPKVPVVLITGYPTRETVTEAEQLGAVDYLSKPVVRETLLEVTKRVLGQGK